MSKQFIEKVLSNQSVFDRTFTIREVLSVGNDWDLTTEYRNICENMLDGIATHLTFRQYKDDGSYEQLVIRASYPLNAVKKCCSALSLYNADYAGRQYLDNVFQDIRFTLRNYTREYFKALARVDDTTPSEYYPFKLDWDNDIKYELSVSYNQDTELGYLTGVDKNIRDRLYTVVVKVPLDEYLALEGDDNDITKVPARIVAFEEVG